MAPQIATHATRPGTARSTPPAFNPPALIITVLAISIFIGLGASWYGERVALPRYCARPEAALTRLRALITDPRPAGDAPHQPYLIAAKLLFLVPRHGNEPLEDYLARVRGRLEAQCR